MVSTRCGPWDTAWSTACITPRPSWSPRNYWMSCDRISPYDPDHLPSEIELIETFRQRHPKLPQVACFDTAFHRTMPRVAKLLPIPRRYDAQGSRALRFPRFVLCLSDGRTGAPGRPGGHRRPRHPRASGQRRQPGRRARRQEHRHQHGLHSHGGIGDEHPLRRFGPWPGAVPGANRAHDHGTVLRNGQPPLRPARSFGDQLRHAGPARAGSP